MPTSSDTIERAVVLPQHLHARPAGRVARAATRHPATTVELATGDRRANARSVLAVMGLGAVQGDEVRVIVSGPDAELVAAEVADILQRAE
jgi:phosphocarrier protein HPr